MTICSSPVGDDSPAYKILEYGLDFGIESPFVQFGKLSIHIADREEDGKTPIRDDRAPTAEAPVVVLRSENPISTAPPATIIVAAPEKTENTPVTVNIAEFFRPALKPVTGARGMASQPAVLLSAMSSNDSSSAGFQRIGEKIETLSADRQKSSDASADEAPAESNLHLKPALSLL